MTTYSMEDKGRTAAKALGYILFETVAATLVMGPVLFAVIEVFGLSVYDVAGIAVGVFMLFDFGHRFATLAVGQRR